MCGEMEIWKITINKIGNQRKMTKFQALPIPKEKLFVWAFIPYRITEQGLIGEIYDNPDYRQELASVFAELGIKWKWQPITLENMHAVVEEVVASNSEYTPVVLNYCDGFDEVDGYPGLSVIKLLEEKGVIFTGADSNFEYLTISKIRMKQALVEAGVSTAPYEVISTLDSIRGTCDHIGIPALVKPSISTASEGIWLDSVVQNDEQIRLQFQRLANKEHGKQCPLNSIFVERFINGSEFTVFLIGNAQHPDNIKVYPAMERVFNPNLPETEQFLAHELYWPQDGEKSSLPPSEPFCRYQLVAPPLHDKLCELSKRAYCAVGGNGYARVDIRMDKASQELFVLEVNANCGISSKPLSTFDDNDRGATSVGTILHLSGIAFAQLMSEIIAEAFIRYNTLSLRY
jgi:D-alanine-D-alanine ligase